MVAEKFLATCFHVTVTDRHLILSRSHMNGISLISTLTCSPLKQSSFEGLQNAHEQVTTEQLFEKREQRLKVYWTTTDVMFFNAQALSPILHFCYSVSVDFCLKLFMCLLCNDRSCHVLIWRDLGWRLLKLLLLPISPPPPPCILTDHLTVLSHEDEVEWSRDTNSHATAIYCMHGMLVLVFVFLFFMGT